MMKNLENNRTEEFGLVTPTPGVWLRNWHINHSAYYNESNTKQSSVNSLAPGRFEKNFR